ncbi:hypothetical protein RclHR1_03490003 [Rhizophagus clarus]|uniref:RGS domain-containing protein n=1 Tax=Rhizophagus clarus TaxID=94130 RepID=A0A2Z6RS32_9GLOM|nr:hypothetical protein RclHR1_03490003 [Rhizophagus clarus]
MENNIKAAGGPPIWREELYTTLGFLSFLYLTTTTVFFYNRRRKIADIRYRPLRLNILNVVATVTLCVMICLKSAFYPKYPCVFNHWPAYIGFFLYDSSVTCRVISFSWIAKYNLAKLRLSVAYTPHQTTFNFNNNSNNNINNFINSPKSPGIKERLEKDFPGVKLMNRLKKFKHFTTDKWLTYWIICPMMAIALTIATVEQLVLHNISIIPLNVNCPPVEIEDAYGLRNELMVTLISGAIAYIAYFLIEIVIPQLKNYVGNLMLAWLTFIICHTLSITIPLIQSFKHKVYAVPPSIKSSARVLKRSLSTTKNNQNHVINISEDGKSKRYIRFEKVLEDSELFELYKVIPQLKNYVGNLMLAWLTFIICHTLSITIPLIQSFKHKVYAVPPSIKSSARVLKRSLSTTKNNQNHVINISEDGKSKRYIRFEKVLEDSELFELYKVCTAACFCTELILFLREYQFLKSLVVHCCTPSNKEILPPPTPKLHITETGHVLFSDNSDLLNSSTATLVSPSFITTPCTKSITETVSAATWIPMPIELHTDYKNFYETFFDSDSDLAINFPGSLLNDIKGMVKNENYELTMYEQAREEVLNLLYRNTFERFLKINELMVTLISGAIAYIAYFLIEIVIPQLKNYVGNLMLAWLTFIICHTLSITIPLIQSFKHKVYAVPPSIKSSARVLKRSLSTTKNNQNHVINISEDGKSKRYIRFEKVLEDSELFELYKVCTAACFCTELILFLREYQFLKSLVVHCCTPSNKEILPPPTPKLHITETGHVLFSDNSDLLNSSTATLVSPSFITTPCTKSITETVSAATWIPMPIELHTDYKNFYETFFDSDSDLAINFPGSLLNDIKGMVKNENYELTMYEQAREEVLNLLYRNTFERFLKMYGSEVEKKGI